jgi:uncharacterized cupin superfamily protein
MPKIDIAAVPVRKGTGYPPSFAAPCAAHRSSALAVYLEVGSRNPMRRSP